MVKSYHVSNTSTSLKPKGLRLGCRWYVLQCTVLINSFHLARIDIATLRSKYNICGVLTGTLPHIPQQNVFLGVPLVIMPEEVVLLVENSTSCQRIPAIYNTTSFLEVAVIVDDILAHKHPTPSVLQKYNDERIEAAILQVGIAKGVKQPESAERAMSEEAIRKRKARAQKKAESPKAEALAVGVSEQLFVPEASIAPVEKPTTSTLQYAVNLPTSSSSLPWNSPDTYTYATLAEAQTAGVWNYPSTHHERAKCGVFRSLWEQGYFMGGGIKFGGDYLVYPGIYLSFLHTFSLTKCYRRPIAISFTLRRECPRLTDIFTQTDGNRRSWATGYGY